MTKPRARKPQYPVDMECRELADHFLYEIDGHCETDIQELSKAIQIVCEDYCSEIEAREALTSLTGEGK